MSVLWVTSASERLQRLQMKMKPRCLLQIAIAEDLDLLR